jgi:hypothetical protein
MVATHCQILVCIWIRLSANATTPHATARVGGEIVRFRQGQLSLINL